MGKFKKEPIVFKQERSFTQLLEAPFKFFTQEFKPLVRTILRYAGPWVAIAMLLLTVFSNTLYNSVNLGSNFDESSIIYIALFAFFYSIGFLATTVATLSYIKLYVDKGKNNFTIEYVEALIKKNVVKIFLAGFLVTVLTVVGVLLFYIPGIYFAIATGFFAIVIVYEDESIGKSISRSFKIIKGSWWITFALILVFGMMVGTIMYIFIIPIYAVIISSTISGTTIGGGSVIVIVFSVILYFIAYVFYMAMLQMLYSFQYFNLVSKKEGLGLYERINAINKPKSEIEETDLNEKQNEDNKKDIDEVSNNISENKDEQEKNRFEDDDENNRFKPKY